MFIPIWRIKLRIALIRIYDNVIVCGKSVNVRKVDVIGEHKRWSAREWYVVREERKNDWYANAESRKWSEVNVAIILHDFGIVALMYVSQTGVNRKGTQASSTRSYSTTPIYRKYILYTIIINAPVARKYNILHYDVWWGAKYK